jgi:hypothetical protein
MCSGRACAALLALLALTSARAATVPAPGGPLAPGDAAELLKQSDVASHSPESFRARLRITPLHDPPEPMEVEVWRSGESKSLVRFLGPKERGKYLLRLDGIGWFLAPGAKRPVKVGAAHRLRGSASLDDLLGIRYGRDYVIESAMETGGTDGSLVVFDLAAKAPHAPYPKVRYVVRRATHRPVRAEYLLRSGKVSSMVEFLEWEAGSRPVVHRLVLSDRLRSGLRTEVLLLEMEERKVPEGLFDLRDATERRKLEASQP